MIRFAETPSPRRAGSFLLVLVGLVAFVAGAFAAAKPRVDNPHGKFREDCELCHNPRAWEQIKVSPKFDHSKYGFPLTGAHATSDCMSCHTTLEFTQSKTKCASCHTDPHRGEMGTECARCHGARSFTDRGPMVRAHQMTRFPLTGSHAALDCESCHQPSAQGRLQYVNTSLECYGCHKAQYATAPDHVTGHFSTQCQTCHNPVRWNDANGFDHAAAGFPLTGGHSLASRKCDDCHHGDYRHTAPDCYACHATSTPGYSTAQPPHDPAAFPTNTPACVGCHVQANATHVSWEGANTFDHAAAGFPLTGQHSSNVRQCQDCHAATGYAAGATSPECISCHQNSTPGYATAQPPHNTTYFPTAKAQCLSCHAGASSFTSWANGTYTHATMPLTNAHANRACEDCHHGNYTTVAYSCYGCHQPAYAAASPVKHTPANFPTSNASCLGCHNTSVFSPSTWPANHSTTTFAAQYSGAHPLAACTDCHNASTWNVQATGSNCYGCHQPDYAGATDPVHDTANFPVAGCTCHSLNAWEPANGHDHTAAGFPLNGQHSTTVRACSDCHATSGYNPGATSKDCFSCHATSNPGYSTAQPPHNATYFPTATANCTGCHATAASALNSWSGGTYTHATMPLTNAHANRACEDCHAGNYTTVAYSCYGCHQPAYAAASPVKHTPANFPTSNASCLGCHNTSVFSPSTWPVNHSTTTFAAQYSGAHLALACTDCHNVTTWNVQGTGTNCYGCHATDYANTTNPHHDTTNYPVAGCICHSLNAWSPATGFDHTAAGFPLTGEHALTVRQCADCHAASGYGAGATSPDCYSCHANANMGVRGYNDNLVVKHSTPNFPTTTPACIACHTAANASHLTWAGGTFSNHAGVTTNFALSGNHGGMDCSDCHTAVTTDLKPYTCSVSCHSGDRDFTQHENKSCAGTNFNTARTDPQIKACYPCHPRGTKSTPC